MKQRLIRVWSDDTKELDSLLEDGWIIQSISACATGRGGNFGEGSSYCYVWLEKN
jgi:hypothetical protein